MTQILVTEDPPPMEDAQVVKEIFVPASEIGSLLADPLGALANLKQMQAADISELWPNIPKPYQRTAVAVLQSRREADGIFHMLGK